MLVREEGGQTLNERFDYSQVDEITAKRLRGHEEEINVQMKRLGYAAHNIGIIKLGKQSDFIERVNVACDELGMERNFLIQAIARYLDGEVK